MRETRKSREQEQRPQSWVPPSVLPDPDPQEGVVFRWIRASTLGQHDPTNMSKRFREGWEPVRAEDHPELQVPDDPTSQYSAKGNVEIGGLVLCRMAKARADQIKAYYDNLTQRQERATSSNYMRGEDPRMPLISQRKSTVTFGSRENTEEKE